MRDEVEVTRTGGSRSTQRQEPAETTQEIMHAVSPAVSAGHRGRTFSPRAWAAHAPTHRSKQKRGYALHTTPPRRRHDALEAALARLATVLPLTPRPAQIKRRNATPRDGRGTKRGQCHGVGQQPEALGTAGAIRRLRPG